MLRNSGYGSDYNAVYELIQVLTNNQFVDDKDNVIIFDEIQVVPVIYRCLRLFTRELQVQVIIAGSYLSMIVHYAKFVPMGDLFSIYDWFYF